MYLIPSVGYFYQQAPAKHFFMKRALVVYKDQGSSELHLIPPSRFLPGRKYPLTVNFVALITAADVPAERRETLNCFFARRKYDVGRTMRVTHLCWFPDLWKSRRFFPCSQVDSCTYTPPCPHFWKKGCLQRMNLFQLL